MPNIDYILNDPVAPIKLKVPVPGATILKYTVAGYVPNPKPGTFQVTAANCNVSVGNTINSRVKAIAKARKLERWAATDSLAVNPRAGQDLNAYYDRRSLKFFYYPTGPNSMIYTADSSDIVTHELGHALLDTLRPDFWDVQALEIWAFHEAFADINALLAIMEYPAALEAAINETNKDIRKSNIITRLAEQVGAAIYGKRHLYLRDAVNNFKYQNPKSLPEDAPDEQLCAECHSFGRVFLGAWYEMVCGIYEQELKTSQPVAAFATAKNTAADYLYKAIVQSPLVPTYHYAIAKGMLLADQANGSKYRAPIVAALQNRNLLPEVKALACSVSKKELVKSLKEEDVVTKRGKVTAVVVKNKRTIKLSDFNPPKALSALAAVEGVNLADVKLEVPADVYYEFDETGKVQDHVAPDDDETVAEAHRCVKMIAAAADIGKTKMWRVARKKLCRSYIA